MKTKITFSKFSRLALLWLILFSVPVLYSGAQDAIEDTWKLPFTGLRADHEGMAAWDADGTGPEPAGAGHQVPLPGFTNYPYYASSADYDGIDPDAIAGAHLIGGSNGFPEFLQALSDNGYTIDQVKFRFDLLDLENDEEGMDWFILGSVPHAFYYHGRISLLLDGVPVITGQILNVDNYYISNWKWITSFFVPDSAWGNNAAISLKTVGRAFLNDIGKEELRVVCTSMVPSNQYFSLNGRDGMFWEIVGYLEKGFPQIRYQGFASQNQGMAGWNADGNGPEDPADGHLAQRYYIASRDYDDIDPDPNAAFGHLISGISGFRNFELQLAYRGYLPSQVLVKNGLSSLGEDVYGQDWGFDADSNYWCNYYDVDYVLELAGDTIISGLTDVSKSWMNTDPLYWHCNVTRDKPRDCSFQAQPDAQIIAQAFMKDMESRHMINNIKSLTYDTATFSGNGRYDGGFFNVMDASLEFWCPGTCTFVQCDTIGGGMTQRTYWKADNSPYLIDNDLVIHEGHTLVVEPGAEVRIRGPYEIIVKGNVEAVGAEDNMITFTRSNPLLKWDGFRFLDMGDAEPSEFSYCIFEHGATFTNDPIANNSGGALYIKDFSDISISNCIFRYNEAFHPGSPYYPTGGAIALWNSSPSITNCEFYENKAGRGGALMCYEASSPVLEYNLFVDNYAEIAGGAVIMNFDAEPVFSHNTMVFNRAGDSINPSWGGAIYLLNDCHPTMNENIIWGNWAYNGSQTSTQLGVSTYSSYFDCYYNDIEFGEDGIGPLANTGEYENNIDMDPELCLPQDHYYLLSRSSPCGFAGPGGSYIGAFPIDPSCYTEVVESPIPFHGMTLYPNPTKNSNVMVAFHLESPGLTSAKIYNLTGEVIAQPFLTEFPAGDHTLVLPTNGLSSGIYLVQLQIGKQLFTEKLIILR